MARIKLGYIGGGSSRAPGTVASFLHRAEKSFEGSEIVLIDLDQERLDLVAQLGRNMARHLEVDVRISTSTDRRAGLRDCDAVLSSFRPGGFQARYFDERIALDNNVIGQETQGPGGFFMALRAIHVTRALIEDMRTAAPHARIYNYTNPVNIVAEAVTHNSDVPIVALCEGPIIFAREMAHWCGLDPAKLDSVMIGLNHGCWSVRHLYDGQDMIPLIARALEEKHGALSVQAERMMTLAVRMNAIPADYFQYYYYRDEVLAELRAKPTTRAQDIMARVPGYWEHYAEQSRSLRPELDPTRSRGGIYELELAFDVMDAIHNDRGTVWPVNVPNRGAIADFPDDLVVEVPGYCDRHGVTPLAQGRMPKHVTGLLKMLGEYQALAGQAAWDGDRNDAIRALAANPLVMSLPKAEKIYNEMAVAHKAYLPERLW